jgi:hypothetical protein
MLPSFKRASKEGTTSRLALARSRHKKSYDKQQIITTMNSNDNSTPPPPPAAKPSSASIYEMVMSQQDQSPTRPSTSYSPQMALHRPVPLQNESNPYSWDQITRNSLPYMQVWKV